MTVRETEVVDFVAKGPGGEFVLAVTEDRPWEDALPRLRQLQTKLQNYLTFYESGQLVAKYPDARDRSIRIELFSFDEPTRDVAKLLAAWRRTFQDKGISFDVKLLSDRREER